MIEQYMDAIHSVADERDEVIMEHTIEIIKESSDAFSAALEIEKAMKIAKLQLIREVFEEFELQMKPYCEKYGLKKESEAEYYVYDEKRQDKFYDCYSTYPGLNYVVERADKFEDKIQLWFRIEFEHNLFAGFTLFDFSATRKDGNKVGYQVQEITPEMYAFAEQYLDRDIFISNNYWWLTFCYSNGIIEEGNYKDVPNFKEMNKCAISLINAETRKKYVQESLEKFDVLLLRKLK